MNKVFIFVIFVGSVYCVGDASDSSIRQDDSRDGLYLKECMDPTEKNCSDLSNLCLQCPDYNRSTSCRYGEWLNVTCHAPDTVQCHGDHSKIVKRARCIYCYQTERWEQRCVQKAACVAIQTSSHYYRTNCTVNSDVMCIGNRSFQRKLKCNWTRGHKWSTALLLSITLGGFGADRFYLGHWQEGIGKLFSFGGLGVWTLVDVLLIAIRYLGPADGSFYV